MANYDWSDVDMEATTSYASCWPAWDFDYFNTGMDISCPDFVDWSLYDPSLYTPAEIEQSYPSSLPLERCSSSGGSSFTTSIPASPDLNNYQLSASPTVQPVFVDHHTMCPAPNETLYAQPILIPDRKVPRSQPPRSRSSRQNSSKLTSGLPCPHCPSNSFKRRADLNRHIQHMHLPPSTLSSYLCDYARCPRRQEPFHRRDHFREHLREYHKEDIEKRNVTVDDSWYEDRNTVPWWWRCGRCLQRVDVRAYGFECPTCGGVCCAKRQRMRKG